jgi:predicted DNA-binding transcriptional regulator AlpA
MFPDKFFVPDILKRYGCCRETLWRWIRDGTFPSPAKPGRDMYWFGSQLDKHDGDQVKQAAAETAKRRDAARKRRARRAA